MQTLDVIREKLKRKYIIMLLFIVMFVFGISTSKDYGPPIDEQMEISIMLSNVKEYAIHLPDSKLKTKILNNGNIANIVLISESEEKDHGEAAYYPFVAITALLSALSYDNTMVIMHVYTFLLFFFIGVLSMYFLSKEMFESRKLACIAALMLYLTPRMFAEGHYNNKDIILLSLAIFSMAWGVRFIRYYRYRDAILCAIGAAFATNTKIVGSWFIAIIGVFYIIELIRNKKFRISTFKVGLVSVITYFAVYVLITPAMWPAPVDFFQWVISNANDFNRWDSPILFDGQLYKNTENALPAYYLPYMMLITTPIYVLVLIAVGTVSVIVTFISKSIKDRKRIFADVNYNLIIMMCIIWLFPLIYAVITRTKLYNGWRHFYFIYGTMIIVATYAVKIIADILQAKMADNHLFTAMSPKELWYAIIGCIFVIMTIGLIINHPYQFAYYNVLAGDDVEDNYELDYWSVSITSILNKVYEEDYDGNGTMTVGALDTWTVVGMQKSLAAMPDEEAESFKENDWRGATYVLVNVTYANINQDKTEQFARIYNDQNYEKLYTQYSYGNEVIAVYKRKVPITMNE